MPLAGIVVEVDDALTSTTAQQAEMKPKNDNAWYSSVSEVLRRVKRVSNNDVVARAMLVGWQKRARR